MQSWRVGDKIVALNATFIEVVSILFLIVAIVVMFQYCQVTVTSFSCCWYIGGVPQSPNC